MLQRHSFESVFVLHFFLTLDFLESKNGLEYLYEFRKKN